MFASGVILSGATTSSSLFFRLSPVSFYLAQCESWFSARKILPRMEKFARELLEKFNF
jgi:hypothetical protein